MTFPFFFAREVARTRSNVFDESAVTFEPRLSSVGPMLSKHILSIELSFSLCLHLGLAFCPPGLCLCMAPLSPLPPFQVPLPLPILLRVPLSPVPLAVRDQLPATVLVVLCVCRSVGNKLPPTPRNQLKKHIGFWPAVFHPKFSWPRGKVSGLRPGESLHPSPSPSQRESKSGTVSTS
jgi:hypothetical protein